MIVAYLEIINIFRIKKGDYMFKENDIVMFIKKEPFNLYERTPEELESIFLFGIVSHDSIGKETKVEVIFANGVGGFSEYFNTEDLINIKDIFDFSLNGEQVWDQYIRYGEALTRKQRYYILDINSKKRLYIILIYYGLLTTN